MELIEFQLILLRILKDGALKVLHSICQQIWKTHQWPQDWKRSVFIWIPRRAMPKNVQTTVQLHSSHMPARQCSKSSKLGVNSILNREHPDLQAGFRKDRGTRNWGANIQKNIYFCFIDYAKAFYCVNHNILENSSRDGNTRPPDLPPEKPVCRSRSNS